MTIRLVALEPAEFPAWMERSASEYAADLVSLGSTTEAARSQAELTLRGAFPTERPNSANAVFNLIDENGSAVGYIWVGPDQSNDPTSWWVWDIVVDSDARGRGHGKAGMLLAEDYARSQGACTLGLSVFGFNRSARGLYESLGYETTSVKMRKSLVAE
ncbi:GNAT family N-acetyltransferase [Arthrobacter sp. MYb211]|uniref:GNAT family N-acetyltransferase n=1 Tax=unclassified Arthrobacter TaxID=235627 RepID=UPI000CFBE2FB|nr:MULTISPECIES: GNAT family N-acetyltransferase [unclassified Arthrobacter]PRA13379.1 GNAT family N-acetyltransferase [Arthrobacter sp. MYb221]PRC10576.1 GNAT family N-acetyltransferase [Arthrobacter sp. MYb211]